MQKITYSKVPLESLGALVSKVATDLTIIADVKSMQFVKPVGDWLKQWKPVIQFTSEE